MIKWGPLTKAESEAINAIAERAVRAATKNDIDYQFTEASMDITAVHVNACELNLKGLLTADDFDFSHDVFGIRRHIDRTTGKLGDCFVPRLAAK